MCFIASSLNPFPPVVWMFALQLRSQLKVVVSKTDLQHPGSPGKQIFRNIWVIVVNLQPVSTCL